MVKSPTLCVFCMSTVFVITQASQDLPTYNIDKNAISMSGFSSGGFMTSQMHIAMSKMFIGVGIVAGGPYHCASSITLEGEKRPIHYMSTPEVLDTNLMLNITQQYANEGKIDPLSFIANDKVYIIGGLRDSLIAVGTVKKTHKLYQQFTNNNAVLEFVDSEHCFPTDGYGGNCTEINDVLMNDCNFPTAHKLLHHIYDDLQTCENSTGSLMQFNASSFSQDTGKTMHEIGLDDFGYVFVPESCENQFVVCRMHVVLHGCTQGARTIGDKFVRNAGYNEIAACNNIVLIYPQAKIIPEINPYGCWDWIGDTGPDYATRYGPQIVTIYSMMKQLAGDELIFD